MSDLPPDPRDFSPHPLVVALAEGLGTSPNARGAKLKTRAKALAAARKAAVEAAAQTAAGEAEAAEAAAADAAEAEAAPAAAAEAAAGAPPRFKRMSRRAADALARELQVDELVMFDGYLGGSAGVSAAAGARDWLVLYRTATLQEWLVVPKDEIVARTTVTAPTAPFGSYDVIWVKQQAPIRHGSGPQSIAATFLTGDFTRAGDFEPSPMGGTFSSPSGLLCAGGSPGCCPRHTTH